MVTSIAAASLSSLSDPGSCLVHGVRGLPRILAYTPSLPRELYSEGVSHTDTLGRSLAIDICTVLRQVTYSRRLNHTKTCFDIVPDLGVLIGANGLYNMEHFNKSAQTHSPCHRDNDC